MSSVDRPWQRRSRTSHSRAVSGLRTGRMPAPSSRVRRTVSTRRVVSRRDTTASPSDAARRARGIDSMFTLFERNPHAAHAQRQEPELLVLGGRDHHDLRVGLDGEDLARRGDAVGAGHQQVHQDHVGLVVQAELDGLSAAASLGDHDDPGALQHITQHSPYERIVIRDYHTQRGA